ncbi:MAG: pilM, partial [Oscillospiraceae bacterium]|nr:pilM [Oscillospiraceae bacterium]
MTTSVYLSNEEVTVVSGKALKKKVKICSFETVPMPEGAIINGKITDDDAVRSILTTLRQGKKIPKKNVRLVIDSSSVMDKIERVP